jgi:hypothetical protein
VADSAAGVKVDGGTVTIRAAGEEDVLRLILDGVTLTSSTGSPFVVQSANEAILFLDEGSTNSIKDAATYTDR